MVHVGDETAEHAELTEGAREVRRRRTRGQIAHAALDLFERQGVAATTVEEIAEAAGVSVRTVYRYAETKENAVFLDDGGAEALRERVRSVPQTASAVIAAIADAHLAHMREFDAAAPAEHERILRVRRLVLVEPALLTRALFREAELVQELTTVVLRASDHPDEIRARTVVTALGTAIRLAFDEWARRAERGERTSTEQLHREITSGLTSFFAAPPTAQS